MFLAWHSGRYQYEAFILRFSSNGAYGTSERHDLRDQQLQESDWYSVGSRRLALHAAAGCICKAFGGLKFLLAVGIRVPRYMGELGSGLEGSGSKSSGRRLGGTLSGDFPGRQWPKRVSLQITGRRLAFSGRLGFGSGFPYSSTRILWQN